MVLVLLKITTTEGYHEKRMHEVLFQIEKGRQTVSKSVFVFL